MEEILYRFEPIHTNSSITLWISLLFGLFAWGICALLLAKKEEGQNRQRNIIIAMLLFFVGMIGLGTAFFTYWTQQKTGPVVIYNDAIETVYGRVSFSQIKNSNIIAAGNRSIINPDLQKNTSRMLLIEENSGKAHVLSEDNYDIQAILNALRTAVLDKDK